MDGDTARRVAFVEKSCWQIRRTMDEIGAEIQQLVVCLRDENGEIDREGFVDACIEHIDGIATKLTQAANMPPGAENDVAVDDVLRCESAYVVLKPRCGYDEVEIPINPTMLANHIRNTRGFSWHCEFFQTEKGREVRAYCTGGR